MKMKKTVCMALTVLMILTVFADPAAAEALPVDPTESRATAVRELEDLITTIDLMDATIAELQAEMEAGHMTAERHGPKKA